MPKGSSLADRLVRPFATLAVRLLRLARRQEGPKAPGAHALALTPGGRLILVKLRYARGWRLPGGGLGDGETLDQAVIRELREEIGMTAHGRVRAVPGLASLRIVEGVAYRPRRWSWEVEQVIEADPAALPPGISPLAAQWIEAAARHI